MGVVSRVEKIYGNFKWCGELMEMRIYYNPLGVVIIRTQETPPPHPA